MLTFLPLEQIDEMDKWEGSQLNQAKEILALRADHSWYMAKKKRKKPQEGATSSVLPAVEIPSNMPTAELADETTSREDADRHRIAASTNLGLAHTRTEATPCRRAGRCNRQTAKK